jgi:hypothetical protein
MPSPPSDQIAHTEDYEGSRRKPLQVDVKTPWWKTLLECAAFVAVIVYTILAGWQLCVMSRQLSEMKALHPQAMVAIDGNKLTADLSFIGEHPMINTSYSVKNYGSAPAINEVDAAIPFVDKGGRETWELFKSECRPGALTPIFHNTHDEMLATQRQTIMPPGMVSEGRQGQHTPQYPFGMQEGNKTIPFLAIEVCIEYQQEVGGTVHHTRYLYESLPEIPPVRMNFHGWSWTKIESFHLERAEAD